MSHFDRSRPLSYRLALDLGSTSLGWAVIELDDRCAPPSPRRLVKLGVRLFSDSRVEKTQESLAVARRLARQARRRRDRLTRRKKALLAALVRLGFFPEDRTKQKKLVELDPYELRQRGLSEALTPEEFGRALFHLNQRRGFQSNRKTDNKDDNNQKLKAVIQRSSLEIRDSGCRTLGEWLYERKKLGRSVRAYNNGKLNQQRDYDFYADRALVQSEFDQLWQSQSKYQPELFNEAVYQCLNGIIFHQRKLKKVRPGRCSFLQEEDRASLALPSQQRFRIYQELNHLRYLDTYLANDEYLDKEDRDTLADVLEGKNIGIKSPLSSRGELTFAKIRNLLSLPSSQQFNLEDEAGKRTRIKANTTSLLLARPENFGPEWHQLSLDEQDDVVEKLLNEESEVAVVEYLTTHHGLGNSQAVHVANLSLDEGYGRLSRKALQRILPHLMAEVVTYDAAVSAAGFHHSRLSEAEQSGEILELLPYYGERLTRHVAFPKDNPQSEEERWGKIANPTVHVGLNQVRQVVNALIRRYGRPTEVVLEVARELKLNKKQKSEIEKRQKQQQEDNHRRVREACEIREIDPDKIRKGTRRELSQKMQLWEELAEDPMSRCCPYSGRPISKTLLLSEEVEIEHILPFSQTLDDSLANKTVAFRAANRYKSNRTPYEAFGKSQDGYDYDAIIARARQLPANKSRRFAPDAVENYLSQYGDFVARALTDTAYLSRVSREYLALICPTVRVIPGRLTALLRGKWGLNSLLSDDGTKNRNDHRHHAVDAMVIGATDQGLLQRFAVASARQEAEHTGRLVADMPEPWPDYLVQVKTALEHLVVSYKPDHGYQGRMHEDTAWGWVAQGRAKKYELQNGKRVRVEENKTLIPIRGNSERHGLDEDGQSRIYKGYVGGSNHCIEISRVTTGKWQSHVITTFEAYQYVRRYGEAEAVRRLSDPQRSLHQEPLVMRLHINDMVKMKVEDKTTGEVSEQIMRVVGINGSGQTFFVPHKEANVDKRNRDKSDDFSYISKAASALQKSCARKVTVSPIGQVKDPGFLG